ncbi:peptide MFS transporter [bacterium]|nr:peptide MFS transporter [bacterium]MBU1652859.1 peptide MFS transporter [bacterium]MBU1880925.1 peptide MFS transporter [bacterium]
MSSATATIKKKHPPGLKVLFLTEMWERFSFYCMLSILSLYMNEQFTGGGLGFSTDKTSQFYGLYVGLVYFTPFFGGIIADRVFGLRKTIIIGGLFMMAGHFLLAFRPLPFFFSALACLIIGNGCFKPNISVMLGNLYRDMPEKKDDGYNIFYMGINVGAFMSPLVATTLRNLHPIHGWHYAFAAAGVGMIISLVTFFMFQKHVRAGENLSGDAANDTGMGREVQLTPAQSKRRVTTLLIIFAVVIFFWMAFHQNGLTLTFWARDATNDDAIEAVIASILNTVIFWKTINFTLGAEVYQSINPMFVLAFTPLLVIFWRTLRRRKMEPSTAAKLGIGMLLTAACYAVMATAAFSGGNAGKVSVAWLIEAYALITLGELCLSPMGLSLVSKLSPWKIRGMMMGGWFAATAIGNYLSGVVGGYWDDVQHSTFFIILVVTSLFAAALLFMLLKFLNPTIKEAEEQARELAAQAENT